MSKNIVFMINVKTGAGKPEYDISIESWRRWCKKNGSLMDLKNTFPQNTVDYSI